MRSNLLQATLAGGQCPCYEQCTACDARQRCTTRTTPKPQNPADQKLCNVSSVADCHAHETEQERKCRCCIAGLQPGAGCEDGSQHTDEVEGHEVRLPAHAPEHAADATQNAIWELVQRRDRADCCHHAHHLHIIHEQVACRKHNSSSGRQHWRVSFHSHTPPSPSHPAVWLEQDMGRMSGHSTSVIQHRQTNVAAHQGCRGTPRCRGRQLSGSPFLQTHPITHDMSNLSNAELHTRD